MIASIEYIKNLFEREGLTPNKNLGQNFFINGNLLSNLFESINLEGRHVVEIGPGPGALTEILLSKGASITAIEKDARMASLLQAALPSSSLSVIVGDCLKSWPPINGEYFVCGNLPYYLTSDICLFLLKKLPEGMALMMQKEAADKFFSLPSHKNYMPMTVVSSLYYDIKLLGEIPPDSYWPQPCVHSAMVYLSRKQDFPPHDSADVYRFVSECFRMRRKTLFNNLNSYPDILRIMEQVGIDKSARAESLSKEQLYSLYSAIKENNR